jgi:hypothetical protein
MRVGYRIGRQAMELARSLHAAVEQRDRLLAGAVGEPAARVDLDCRPALHELGSQILERDVAEVRQDVVAEDRDVVAERGRLALAVLLDVAQVLGASVSHRRAGADHAGLRSGRGFGEHAAEPCLG